MSLWWFHRRRRAKLGRLVGWGMIVVLGFELLSVLMSLRHLHKQAGRRQNSAFNLSRPLQRLRQRHHGLEHRCIRLALSSRVVVYPV